MMLYLILYFVRSQAWCFMLLPLHVIPLSGLLCPSGRNCGLARAKVDSHAFDFGHLTLMKLGSFFCLFVMKISQLCLLV